MLGFFLKTLFLLIVVILIRASIPRYRLDQLTTMHWKSAIFFYIIFTIFFIISIQLGGPDFAQAVIEFYKFFTFRNY